MNGIKDRNSNDDSKNIENYRLFCDVFEDQSLFKPDDSCEESEESESFSHINENLVGRLAPFQSPYGFRPLVYADWTATGRSLRMIEEHISSEVLPFYGNTHTSTSITGNQSTCYRHEARQIIAEAVNAKITGRAAEDVVLFCGTGSTGAISKLIQVLGLHHPLPSEAAQPVVFVGPYEHHSNLLPWRESCAEVVTVREKGDTGVDLDHLQELLTQYAERPLKIGSFTAASNVTGVLVDVDAVTSLLHRHSAFVFWDYATAAPYMKVDMNPVIVGENAPFVYKDAVFISGHKFVGGPGTPGILVVKKCVLCNAVPTSPGGGTVFYVTHEGHRYLSNREEREEGGTPDILGTIRLGLVFQMHQQMGWRHIQAKEEELATVAKQSLLSHKNICLLGDLDAPRLPIFSFLVKHGPKFLHFNFVSALLNDLFGIQSRGGCMCAGPYSQRLLGLDPETSQLFENALLQKNELLRPGYTRLSFTYFVSQDEVQYILKAIHHVASFGHLFLPQYRFNHKTGEWKHTTRFTRFPERRWLGHFNFRSGQQGESKDRIPRAVPWQNHSTADVLNQIYTEVFAMTQTLERSLHKEAAVASEGLGEDVEYLRWFWYPWEIPPDNDNQTDSRSCSINPARYKELCKSMKSYLEDKPKGKIKPESTIGPPGHQNVDSSMKVNGHVKKEAQTNGKLNAKAEQLKCDSGACFRPRSQDPPQIRTLNKIASDAHKYPLRNVGALVNPEQPLFQKPEAMDKMQQVAAKSSEAKLFPTPPKKLLRSVGQAIKEWNMIEEGDRLCLGLSGGKDSLTLLHVLLTLQKRAPINFEIACATVDPMTASFDPRPLIPYMESLGVPYHYIEEPIIENAKDQLQGDSICSFCSRMKRGLLYACLRENKYNKLVLAQHLDDLTESFIMSSMHNGQLRTMKAHYKIDAGDLSVIRPLVYTREILTKEFARNARLPVINENCPACFEQPKERARVKKMLAKEESLFPDIYRCMRRAILPLMDHDIYQNLKFVNETVEQRKKRPSIQHSKKHSKRKAVSTDKEAVN